MRMNDSSPRMVHEETEAGQRTAARKKPCPTRSGEQQNQTKYEKKREAKGTINCYVNSNIKLKRKL